MAPRRRAHAHRSGVDQESLVLCSERFGHRIAVPARANVEYRQSRGVFNHRGVANAVNEFTADPHVERGDQAQPKAGQARCERGHGQNHPSQPSLSRVLSHEPAVRYPIRSADFEHPAGVERQFQSRKQVVQQVRDGNGLRRHGHPMGRDHHRQPFHQGADHFEGETAGADHDGRAEFNDRNSGRSQDLTHFLAAAQMRGELLATAQSTQVDDPMDSSLLRGLAEEQRRGTVLLLERSRRGHGMNQIVGRVRSHQGRLQASGVERVPANRFRPRRGLGGVAPPAAAPGSARDGRHPEVPSTTAL